MMQFKECSASCLAWGKGLVSESYYDHHYETPCKGLEKIPPKKMPPQTQMLMKSHAEVIKCLIRTTACCLESYLFF